MSGATVMATRLRKRSQPMGEDPPPFSNSTASASVPTTTPLSTPASTPSPGDNDFNINVQDSQIWGPVGDSEFPWFSHGSNTPRQRRRLSKTREDSLPPAHSESLTRDPSKTPTRHGTLYGPAVSSRPPPDVVFSPVLPAPEAQFVEEWDLRNPFEDNADDTDRLVLGKSRIQAGAIVDGYIKFHNGKSETANLPRRQRRQQSDPQALLAELSSQTFLLEAGLEESCDKKLFQFYIKAWCSGRSVLHRTNCWLVNVPRIMKDSSCVKHAMLALAGTYVLDYQPEESIRKAANAHYKRAAMLLTMALREARNHVSTEREANCLIAAVTLLNMIDVVSPEQRRPPSAVPRWLEGARLACRLLDATDPGHRYWNAVNIQPSETQMGNMIIAGRAAILALPMAPLDSRNTEKRQFAWLLQGSELDAHRIHGGCGMSPTLLHHFSIITHLAAWLWEDPDNNGFYMNPGVKTLHEKLSKLRQWTQPASESPSPSATSRSDQSRDISDPSSLLDNIKRNEYGLITDAESMTEVTAEAWRLAAIIYLRCRLERLPRSHPNVVSEVLQLVKCVRMMPTYGTFFTAQAPFFPVFLLGIVATQEAHSLCALKWFESVVSTGCRSSVPPAFKSLLRIREWIAASLDDSNPSELAVQIQERAPWWETLVAHIASTEGTLCLI
ncbi:hypothetical protein CORC01_14190 [Colletotrichum orchidophilum]|uniref:Fungal specific transcription factor domain-containing protein n=1 Tax=Colletotrichum orchidophilum TaxID=1209926 RepID=A0A1G4AN25_9PEZI|nr:uncharacterized protein CORC01_14190 [Colletotrichum orchidophilum]OHE90521.1 hypothetical protein CORC01_14190 [Colletotrichum orchidophilum]